MTTELAQTEDFLNDCNLENQEDVMMMMMSTHTERTNVKVPNLNQI